MARKPIRVSVIKIDPYEAREAANTIARAHEHLQNKPLMRAVKAHVDGLSRAVTGGLKPRPVRSPMGKKPR